MSLTRTLRSLDLSPCDTINHENSNGEGPMILQHLQHRGTEAYILPEEDLQQMQRSLLDINNLLTIAYKELLEENEVLRRQLEQARTFRQTGY